MVLYLGWKVNNQIEEYKDSLESVNLIKKDIDLIVNKKNEEARIIRDEYWDKIRLFEHERDNKIEIIEDSLNEKIKERNKEIDNLELSINKIRSILSLIATSRRKTDLSLNVYSNYNYGGKRNNLKPIGILGDDEFKNIRVYITKNNKPKNKYSLYAVGMSVFRESLIKMNKDYTSIINRDGGYLDIEKHIKDLPEEKLLLSYYEKNKNEILKDFLAEHKKVEEKYKFVLKSCLTKDWIRLYLEEQKIYYEVGYYNGTETEEYKKILKELKELN